jgi:hypothetical protein
MECDNCDSLVRVTFEPYGSSLMGVFDCPKCGTWYDTDADASDVQKVFAESGGK